MTIDASADLMDDETLALWRRIQQTPMNKPGRTDLAAALPLKSALKGGQVQVVMEEYRRYLLLALLEPRTVPPDLLAYVNRLHRADEAAWEWFCNEALGGPLPEPRCDPDPDTDPDPAQALAHYVALFGGPPDRDVWPSPAHLRLLRRMGRIAALLLGVFALSFAGLVLSTGEGGEGAKHAVAGSVVAGGSLVTAILLFSRISVLQPWPYQRSDSGGGMGDGGGD